MTFPVKPETGVTVTVEVLPVSDPAVTVTAVLLMVKSADCEALTVKAMVVVPVNEPEVPVMVTVEVPAVAVLAAVKVITLVPVVGFVPKAAVTPGGRPEAVNVTLPLKLFTSVTVMVSVALLP